MDDPWIAPEVRIHGRVIPMLVIVSFIKFYTHSTYLVIETYPLVMDLNLCDVTLPITAMSALLQVYVRSEGCTPCSEKPSQK